MISAIGKIPPMIRRTAKSRVYHSVDALRHFVRAHPRLKRRLLPVIRLGLKWLPILTRSTMSCGRYNKWISRHDVLTKADRAAIRAHILGFSRQPLLSVVMATYETPERLLREAVRSLQGQIYANWELCVADDGSSSPHVMSVLETMAAQDTRIHVIRRPIRGHISAASNSALALAKGEFVVLMDHDDLLSPDALYEVAVASLDHPDVQVIYSDEDKIDGRNRRFDPYFKPDFDPDLLLGQNLLNHLSVYRTSLIRSIGGFREGYEGAQDHDLALRATAACGPQAVHHIPRILYHWRQQSSRHSFSESAMARCIDASRRALGDHMKERGIDAQIELTARLYHRIVFPVPDPAPLVSVLIPTKNYAGLLEVCLDGLLNKTEYPSLEIVIADNGSSEPDAIALLERYAADPRVRVLDVAGPFNFARITNNAASHAKGEILLLLNNDIEVIDKGWLRELVSHACRPEIGAVGCRLLYPDGRLQHGGTIVGAGGVAGHVLVGAERTDPGPFGSLALLRSMSAVTAACLAVRKTVWNQVGGMDEDNLAVAFNDVDLCLKIRQLGLRNVCTPFAELYHHESASRGDDLSGEKALRFGRECTFMQQKWGETLLNDPYYNLNFSLDNANLTLASPPRYKRDYHTEM